MRTFSSDAPLVSELHLGWQNATHLWMSQPVKLSDDLVLDARLTGEAAERSIAGQVEYWASCSQPLETYEDIQF